MKAIRILLVAVLFAGCSEPITPLSTPGPAEEATLRLTANVAGTSVDQLVVKVTAADIPTPLVFNIPVSNGTASGTLRLPPGLQRTVSVEAFDNTGLVTHDGSAVVDVRPGQNPPVSILLRPRAGQVPIVVTIAEITVQVSPGTATLQVGNTVQLTATILGPNNEVLTGSVMWATSNPSLAKVDQQGLVTALAPGQALIVAVSDGVAGVSQITIPSEVATTGSVIVTEIMVNPEAAVDPLGEWLELHNLTNVPVNVEKWTLSDDGMDFHEINVGGAGLIIPPGGYLVLGHNADQATNGGVRVDYQYSNFLIGNGGDEIVLKDGLGAQVDRVAYGLGWTVLPGRSISLDPAKFDATLNDVPASWCASITVFGAGDKGTPGVANDLCLNAANVFRAIDHNGAGVAGVEVYLDEGATPIGTTDATGSLPRNLTGVHSVHFRKAGVQFNSHFNRDWTVVSGTVFIGTNPFPGDTASGAVDGTISNTANGDLMRVWSRRFSDGSGFAVNLPVATGPSAPYSLNAAPAGTSDLFVFPSSIGFPAASSFVGYSPGIAVPSQVSPVLVRGTATSFAVTGAGGFPAPGMIRTSYAASTNPFLLGSVLIDGFSALTSGATLPSTTVNVPPLNLVYPGANYGLRVEAFSGAPTAAGNYQVRNEFRLFATHADLVGATPAQDIVLTDDALVPIGPAHNALNVSVVPTFTWSRSGSPDFVEISVSEYDPVRLNYVKAVWYGRIYDGSLSATLPAAVTLNANSFYAYSIYARRDLANSAGAFAGRQRNGWERIKFSTGSGTPP